MISWIHSLLPSQVQYTNIFHLRQQCDFITMNLEKDDVEWNWKVWKQSLWSASLGNYFSSSIFWINRNPIKNNIRDRGSTALYTALWNKSNAMGAMTLRNLELCPSFSPDPNISDGNFNLDHHCNGSCDMKARTY